MALARNLRASSQVLTSDFHCASLSCPRINSKIRIVCVTAQPCHLQPFRISVSTCGPLASVGFANEGAMRLPVAATSPNYESPHPPEVATNGHIELYSYLQSILNKTVCSSSNCASTKIRPRYKLAKICNLMLQTRELRVQVQLA